MKACKKDDIRFVDLSMLDEATPEQKAATTRMLEQQVSDEAERLELMQMLGLATYERTISNNHGNPPKRVMSDV